MGNLIPVIAGPILLRAHAATICAWVLVRIAVSIDEHSGYSFPWSPVHLLPFGASADGHDYHHSHNDGIYGSQFAWWDALCGTEGRFHEWRAAVQASGSGKLQPKALAAAGEAATPAPAAAAGGSSMRSSGRTTRAAAKKAD